MPAAIFNLQLFKKQKDYPARYWQGNLTGYVFVLFGLILVFLYLFRPFGVNEAEDKFSYFTTCCLHALLPALMVYVYFSSLNFIRKKSEPGSWTLAKELFHLVNMFLLIGIGGYFLRAFIYTSPNNLSLYYLWIEVRDAFLAGSLICSYVVFAQIYFEPVNKIPVDDQFKQTDADASSIKLASGAVFIKAHVKIDDFYLNPNDLLFAKADGNYVTLTMMKDSGLKNELKRISLKQLELQLSAHTQLIRCHRAYLVNVQQVAKFSGNSQGYSISFNSTTDKVPVSRAYLEIFDQSFRQLSIA